MDLDFTLTDEWQGLSKQEQQQHLFLKQKGILDTRGSHGSNTRNIRKEPLCRMAERFFLIRWQVRFGISLLLS